MLSFRSTQTETDGAGMTVAAEAAALHLDFSGPSVVSYGAPQLSAMVQDVVPMGP